LTVRQNGQTAVLDGGLDLDYHLFTRAFFLNGYLTLEDFDLCRRFYTLLRGLLPPPELVIYLIAPIPLLAERRAARSREIDIARTGDLDAMQVLLEEWIETIPKDSIIRVDSGGDPGFARSLPLLLERIRGLEPPLGLQ
jgi:deoxyadenosine/deoxycytidine kinase